MDSAEKTPEPAQYVAGMAIDKSSLCSKRWYTAQKHPSGYQLSMLSTKQTMVHNIQILQKHYILESSD
jgi:hypothetical protein